MIDPEARLAAILPWIPKKYHDKKWSNFDRSRIDDPRLALWDGTPPSVLIWSPVTGCGKSHQASAMMWKWFEAKKELPGKEWECAFFDCMDLLEKIKEGYDSDAKERIERAVRTLPLLVLDELPGPQESTVWGRGKLKAIFQGRFNDLLPTICTGNLDKAAISTHYGPSLASRLFGFETLCVKATHDDYRFRPRKSLG